MRARSLVLPFAVTLSASVAVDSNARDVRTYVPGSYVLYVDGQPGASVPLIGGGISTNVIVDRSGAAGAYPKKHAGSVQYEDITFAIDLPDKPLADWMKATVNAASPVRKSGAYSALVGDREQTKTSWANGFISDITFPELDAASKDPARIAVTITPSSTSVAISSAGGKVRPAAPSSRQRPLGSNFRLSIPGIDTSMVSHVDPISVRFKTVTTVAEERREYEKTPGQVDVSNLVFDIAESAADPVYKWHQDFVVKGNNSDAAEKTARLELLSPDLKTVLWGISLKGVGILKVSPYPPSLTSIRRVRAEAYVESVQIDAL